MKIKSQYQGVVLTDTCLQIHFSLEIGGTTKRHVHVKVPLDELAREVWAKAIDKATRRHLLEMWSADQDILPWDSDD